MSRGVLERWSATENVTGALECNEKKGWSARVLELRKTSWSAGKLKKIGWSAGALILNCLERWSARQKIVGAWSRGMYWSAGALKEKKRGRSSGGPGGGGATKCPLLSKSLNALNKVYKSG